MVPLFDSGGGHGRRFTQKQVAIGTLGNFQPTFTDMSSDAWQLRSSGYVTMQGPMAWIRLDSLSQLTHLFKMSCPHRTINVDIPSEKLHKAALGFDSIQLATPIPIDPNLNGPVLRGYCRIGTHTVGVT
jgi:hypothetical protein